MKKLLITVLLFMMLCGIASAGTYDHNTTSVLLMNGTSNSTTITDQMGTVVQWTSTGIANISADTKLFGSGSLFNSNSAGTTGYIKTSNTTVANFGTGDFTIEMSIYPTGIRTSAYSMIMCEPTGTESPSLMLYDNASGGTSGLLNFYDGTTYRGGTQLTFNRWWNVSVVRQSGNLTLYVEGISNGSFSSPGAVDFGAAYIGHDSATTLNDFRGFIDNVRISNTARYTGNYIPRNYEWGDEPPAGPYVPAVTSILLLNGTANSTTITDEMGSVVPWVSTGIANISTSTKLFGSGSLSISDASGTLGYAKTSNVSFANFGQGNLTIEMSIYPRSIFTSGYSTILCEPSGSEKPIFALYDNTGGGTSGRLQLNTGTSTYNGTVQLTSGRWWNVSVVRDNGNLTLYVEGISNGSYSSTEYIDFGAAYLGHDSSDSRFDFRGYIDNVRVSNYAQHTGNYVPTNYEWGLAPDTDTTSTLSLLPASTEISEGTKVNLTLTALDTFAVPLAVNANVTWNKSAVNLTNVFLNNTALPGNTLVATISYAGGWAEVNVSNSSGMDTTTSVPLADLQFDAIDGSNTTVPINYNSSWYISSTGTTNFPIQRGAVINITKPLIANFSTFNYQGTAPFTTYYYDTSTNKSGSVTYYWMFGDGNTSTSENGYFTWNTTGTYSMNHSVSDGLTTSWYNKSAYIVVGTPTPPVVAPVASFYGGPQLGAAPLTVFFTDVSTNTPTSWNWSLGDGTFNETQNPTYTYTGSGFFTVSLTATNSAGSNTTSQTNFVMVY